MSRTSRLYDASLKPSIRFTTQTWLPRLRVRAPEAPLRFTSKLLLLIVLMISAAFLANGQGAQVVLADPSELAPDWFDLQLKLVKETPGFTPPVAARAFGYSGVALYEAIVPGMDGYQTLAGQLNDLKPLPQPDPTLEYDWPAVANSALATITRRMFPTASGENLAAIDDLYNAYANTFAADSSGAVFERSDAQGRIIAEAIYDWSMTDGGHEGYNRNFPADFVPPTGSGLWVPTPQLNGADPLPAMLPYWGNNRPFVLESGEACAVPDPIPYSEAPTSHFYAEAWEVYQAVNNLTVEQAEIANFWSDDPGTTATPGGHSMSILTQLLRQEQARLDEAAEAYAKMGIALADAFIGCWNGKYQHNLVRPVTYIQRLFNDEWMPILNTPPFPEYPSGHSVQSGAAATVLSGLFGENYTFVDRTHEDRGFEPRLFHSFDEFAQEAAMSRLYGGIHYRAAIELGVAQGECIGEQVNALQFRTA